MFWFQFQCSFLVSYNSIVLEYAHEDPIIGSTERLKCLARKRGFPEEIQVVKWYKDGERINENQKYRVVDASHHM